MKTLPVLLIVGVMFPGPLIAAQPPATTAPSTAPATPQRQQLSSRRSPRVLPFEQVVVASPDGQVKFTLAPNPERLTFSVALGDTIVIESSTIRLVVDGFDFGSGVAFEKIERSEINETHP